MVLSSFCSSSRSSCWLAEDEEEDAVGNARRKEESFSHAFPTDKDANRPDIRVNSGSVCSTKKLQQWRYKSEEME